MRDPALWTVTRLARRVAAWVRRPSVESAMDDEMRYHIECEIQSHIDRGMSRHEAERIARRDFGGVERHKDDARDTRGFTMLDDAARDLGYAARVLRRSPAFAVAVVLTFALGIGCTTTIFSLVHGILLRPLPYKNPAELVALWERNVARNADHNVVSWENFDAWRARTTAFAGMAAMVPAPRTIAGSPAERISAAQVSPSFFAVLGVHPVLGRDFAPEDETNGGGRVAILSDGMWRARFGASASAIGRSIVLDGEAFTIIGVMPEAFEPPRFGWMSDQAIWIPFAVTEQYKSWGRFLHVIARRAPGVTVEAATADLARVGAQLAGEIESNRGWSTNVVALDEQMTGDVRRPLIVVFAAVLVLLLMSVVNVANLVTSFARRRAHELTVRRALGASRARLIRQQLTQSLLLGLLGAGVGVAVTLAAGPALVAFVPDDVPRLDVVKIDGSVLAFGTIVALATTVLFGVISAIRSLSATASTTTARVSARLGGSRLVAAEIALGLVLSAMAALMVRSLINLRSVDLGFQATSVVAGRVSLPSDRYRDAERQGAFFDALLSAVRAVPGVTSASIATTRPFACCAPATVAVDAIRRDENAAGTTDVRFVDESYFATLRVPVIAGGVFAANELRDGPPRAVVTRSLARALWGSENPIGKRVSMKLFGTTTAEVIGVVADVHLADARTAVRPALFLSTARYPSSERDIIVRGSADAPATLAAVREALASLDASLPLYRATSLETAVDTTLARDRFTALLLSAFAVLALLLAAVGVYGVFSSDVTQRRREIGIRLALGADRASVLVLVLRRALVPTAIGLIIGTGAALTLARTMSAMVFGIATTDAVSFVGVGLVLAAVALLATLIPAIRAARVPAVEVIKES
jgi:predicted permease